jgi:hypothetical protein
MTVTHHAFANHPVALHVERRERRCCAMARVIVGARGRAAINTEAPKQDGTI